MGLFSQPSYPQVTTQQATQTPQLSPEQQNLQNVTANFLSGQVGQNAPAYTGTMTAPLSPAQQTQIQQGYDLGQQSYWPQQQGLGTLGAFSQGAYLPWGLGQAGGNALTNIASGAPAGPPGPDPFLAAQLGATTQQAQQQFAASVPQLRAPFIAAGQTGFSSPELAALYGASAQAATGLQSNLANELMTASQQNQQNELARQQQQLAAGQSLLGAFQNAQQMQLTAAPQAVQAGGTVQTMADQLAALPQQTQQAQYNAAYQDWLRQIAGAWTATGVPAVNTLAAMAPTTTQATTTAPPLYGPSPFESLLGGLGAAAGPAATYMIGRKQGFF